MAPRYTSQIKGTEVQGTEPLQPVGLGTFEAKSPEVNRVRLRTMPMTSPAGSFEQYLEQAVQLELEGAGLLDPASTLTLSGVLLRNHMSAGSGARGHADLEALFIIRRGGTVLYEQPKSAHHEWWAPWSADIAIPVSAENYPVAVGKLIRALLSDPAFRKVLRK